jgi:hypothetical protein
MSSDLQELQRILGESIELIQSRVRRGRQDQAQLEGEAGPLSEAVNTSSLLQQCSRICDEYRVEGRPIIRVVHHLACSGGTLISKCIASMPNVFVLSEVHPNSAIFPAREKPMFTPADMVTLSRYAGFPDHATLAETLFKVAISNCYQHISERGGTLVLRDHSHSDFCVGTSASDAPALVGLLRPDFEVLSVVTIRNPIDCYISLHRNNWCHFEPFSFEEYCKRYMQFLDAYDDCRTFIYEDFVADPESQMQEICKELQLPYDDTFEQIFEVSKMTGDSGRSSGKIQPRHRLALDQDLAKSIETSPTFEALRKRFAFDDTLG